ncbi:MAG TPA: cytochrome c3 family protein [Caulobacteraceae bacterium]|nr:cytochrome c3 family protein [Caulobacteraceae bacterium]
MLTGPLLVIGGLVTSLWTPYTTGLGHQPEQPIPFSHKHHVGEDGIDCRYCHATVETTAFAGMPSTHVCMTCHSQLFTSAPMLAPVRESLAEHKPLTWRRVYELPDYVYFDHSIHIAKGVGCAECHGPVARMPLTRQAVPLKMGWCLNCHRDPGPHLRPAASITDTSFTAHNTPAQAAAYVRAYHIHTAHLTDCSVCHR